MASQACVEMVLGSGVIFLDLSVQAKASVTRDSRLPEKEMLK